MDIKLTLEQAVGQVLMVNPDTKVFGESPKLNYVCEKFSPGAFIIFQYCIESIEQIRKLNINLVKNCKINPLISVDIEGGRVNRFKDILPGIGTLSAKQMAELGPDAVYTEACKIASACDILEFTLNLGIVLDSDGVSKSIGQMERSFGIDPQIVYEYCKLFKTAHDERKIATCMKHFPGQGHILADAHENLIETGQPDPEELETFILAFNDESMGPFLMTAHTVVKSWDSKNPVTLSPIGISKIRDMGFDGVILSDDIFMKGLSKFYSAEEIITKFFNAGGDMLLVGNSRLSKELFGLNPLDFFDITLNLVKEGKIPEKRIFDAANRIISAKESMSLL